MKVSLVSSAKGGWQLLCGGPLERAVPGLPGKGHCLGFPYAQPFVPSVSQSSCLASAPHCVNLGPTEGM